MIILNWKHLYRQILVIAWEKGIKDYKQLFYLTLFSNYLLMPYRFVFLKEVDRRILANFQDNSYFWRDGYD